MINKELKLYCEKCKQVRKFDVEHKYHVSCVGEVNHYVESLDEFDPNFDMDYKTNISYEISIKCSYCNHEIYNEEATEKDI